jgi:hypothetical protein
MRARHGEVKGVTKHRRGFAGLAELLVFQRPLPLHHDRQAVHDHIYKTANA